MKALMYHYVRNNNKLYPYSAHERFDHFKLTIDRFIHEGYRFINVSDCLTEGLSGGLISSKSIMLTFDDGLSDHYYVANYLNSKGINKATFYIPTYPLTENKLLAVHKAHIIRAKYGPGSLELLHKACDQLGIDPTYHTEYGIEKERYSTAYTHQNDDSRTKEFKRLINYFGSLGVRDKLLDQIMINQDINVQASEYYLSRSQIHEMSSMGFEIGSHGVSHTLLSRLTRTEQHRELLSSKLILEDIIRSKINSFCYPYGGKKSYDNNTLSELAESEYTTAISVEYRDVSIEDINEKPFELPRYDCNQVDTLFKY